jgi:putative salt-induced outer membrane protein
VVKQFNFKKFPSKVTAMSVAMLLATPLVYSQNVAAASVLVANNVVAVPYNHAKLPVENTVSNKMKPAQAFKQVRGFDEGAAGAEADEYVPWAGDVEVGVVLSSGNTESTAVRINTELLHEMEDFRNKYLIQTLLQRNSKFDEDKNDRERYTTAQRLNLVAQTNYKFYRSEHSIFGRAAYLNDRFGAFHEQASFAGGYAKRLYEEAESYWDFETGPGFAHQETSDGERSTGLIWFVATNLDYQLNENNSFRQALEWSVSLDGKNSSWQSRSALTSQVNGQLSMRLSFVVKYDSSPSDLRKKTDTETAATLVYGF